MLMQLITMVKWNIPYASAVKWKGKKVNDSLVHFSVFLKVIKTNYFSTVSLTFSRSRGKYCETIAEERDFAVPKAAAGKKKMVFHRWFCFNYQAFEASSFQHIGCNLFSFLPESQGAVYIWILG